MTRRALGVDFSGAADAGRRLWVAVGRGTARGLCIEACWRGDELPGSRVARRACLRAVREFLSAQAGAVIGLDFPFSLPLRLLEAQAWEVFVAEFSERFRSPEQLRAWCLARAGGRELKRQTDQSARAPFSPYNLRLYRQTFYGLRDVLAPLVCSGGACVSPMQPVQPGKPCLIEICPASTLKAEGWAQPYKGPTARHRAARRRIVAALEARGLEFGRPELRRRVVADPKGDALDSVLAAWAAARAQPQQLRARLLQAARGAEDRPAAWVPPGRESGRAAGCSGAAGDPVGCAWAALREGWVFV